MVSLCLACSRRSNCEDNGKKREQEKQRGGIPSPAPPPRSTSNKAWWLESKPLKSNGPFLRIPVAIESRRSPQRRGGGGGGRCAPRALYPQIRPQGNLSFRCVLKRSKVCYNGTFCGVQKSKGVRLGEEPARIKLLSTFFDFSPSEPSAPSGPRLWRLHYLLRLRPNVCLGPNIHDVEMVRDWFSVKLLDGWRYDPSLFCKWRGRLRIRDFLNI